MEITKEELIEKLNAIEGNPTLRIVVDNYYRDEDCEEDEECDGEKIEISVMCESNILMTKVFDCEEFNM